MPTRPDPQPQTPAERTDRPCASAASVDDGPEQHAADLVVAPERRVGQGGDLAAARTAGRGHQHRGAVEQEGGTRGRGEEEQRREQRCVHEVTDRPGRVQRRGVTAGPPGQQRDGHSREDEEADDNVGRGRCPPEQRQGDERGTHRHTGDDTEGADAGHRVCPRVLGLRRVHVSQNAPSSGPEGQATFGPPAASQASSSLAVAASEGRSTPRAART
jgi:hypothetical protein